MDMIEFGTRHGTQTAIGYIPHLELFGIRMPIMVYTPGSGSFSKLPKPRIYGNASVWAAPGGLQYIHREPIEIVR